MSSLTCYTPASTILFHRAVEVSDYRGNYGYENCLEWGEFHGYSFTANPGDHIF